MNVFGIDLSQMTALIDEHRGKKWICRRIGIELSQKSIDVS